LVEVNGEFKKISIGLAKNQADLIDGIDKDPNTKKFTELFIRNFMSLGDEVNIRKIDESFGKINAIITKDNTELQEILFKTGMKSYVSPKDNVDNIKLQFTKESEQMKSAYKDVIGRVYKDLESIGIQLKPKDFNNGVMRSFIDSYMKEYYGTVSEINKMEKLYDKVPEFKLPNFVFDEATASKELLEYNKAKAESDKIIENIKKESNTKQIIQMLSLTSGASQAEIYQEDAEAAFKKTFMNNTRFNNSKLGETEDFKAFQTKWTTDYVNFMKQIKTDTLSINQEIASSAEQYANTILQEEQKKLKQYESIMANQYEAVVKMGGTGEEVLELIKKETERVVALAKDAENQVLSNETSKIIDSISKKMQLIAEVLPQHLANTNATIEDQKQFALLFAQVQKEPKIPLFESLLVMAKKIGINEELYKNLEATALNFSMKTLLAEEKSAAKTMELNRQIFDYFVQLEDKRIEAIKRRYDLENLLSSNQIKEAEQNARIASKNLDNSIQSVRSKLSAARAVDNTEQATMLEEQLKQLEKQKSSLNYNPIDLSELKAVNDLLQDQEQELLNSIKTNRTLY
jgi:hypothetical protein